MAFCVYLSYRYCYFMAFLVLPFAFILTYLLTPWSRVFLEKHRFSASSEISRILWKQKVHYRIHKCPLPVPILIQLDTVHAPTSHFLKIHPSIYT